MALAMADVGRPLVAACESFKMPLKYPEKADGDEVALEEMSGKELGYGEAAPFEIRNVYFEVTPARFVSAWCTEQGVAHDPAELLRLTRVPSHSL